MKKFVSFILTIILAMSLFIPVSAMTIDADDTVKPIYTVDVPYAYPFTVNSDEWNSFDDITDRRAALEIPSDILSSMTTEALLESVLNYPYLLDIRCFNTLDLGVSIVRNRFNGLDELLNRSDYEDVLANAFAANQIAIANIDSASQDSAYYLLGLDSLVCYSLNDSVEPTYDMVDYVYTPNGTPVAGWRNVTYEDHDTSSGGAAIRMASYVIEYFDIEIVDGNDPTYNCHSYAWYSQATDNNFWMSDEVSDYVVDGSYDRVYSPAAGRKVLYADLIRHIFVHSAICVDNSGLVISKWGCLSLVKHQIEDSPYWDEISGWSEVSYWVPSN